MKNRNLSHSDNWQTPTDIYNKLNERFNFDFDPCPLNHNMEWDGLEVDWGNSNFINPPYNQKLKQKFVIKAIQESQKGKVCVMLLPVSTSTKLFHDLILPNASQVMFLKGRVKFKGINTFGELVDNKSPMHDSMVVVFDKKLITTDKAIEILKQLAAWGSDEAHKLGVEVLTDLLISQGFQNVVDEYNKI